MVVRPYPATHITLVELFGGSRRLMNTILFRVLGWAVPVAECLENHTAIENCKSTVTGLHFQVELGAPGTRDVEGLVAVLVTALYAGTHLLVTDVTRKFPPSLWNLLNIHYGLHERMVTERDLWYPHRTKQMSPFRGIGLLECTVSVRAEDARL